MNELVHGKLFRTPVGILALFNESRICPYSSNLIPFFNGMEGHRINLDSTERKKIQQVVAQAKVSPSVGL